MKVATFNTNSVRARLPIILEWLEKEQPDILCLQETKVQDKDFPVGPFNDKAYGVAIRGQKSYNGVAILSKHPIGEIRFNLYDGEDEEARFISARICGIPVIDAYVPQGVSPESEKFAYKLHWLRDLLAHIRENYEQDRPLLLAGDFNVALEPRDVFDPEGLHGEVGFHPQEQGRLQEYLDWGLVDVFRRHEPATGHYTFWDYRVPNALKRQMGWRIDYILATTALAEKSRTAWIDTKARSLSKPSDHTFLVAEFDLDLSNGI